MIFRKLMLSIHWDDVVDFKPAIKITNAVMGEYKAKAEFSESFEQPKERLISVGYEQSISEIDQKYFWEMSASTEYQDSWAMVTSSTWFNTNVTSSGYHVTGSTPNLSSGLDYPVMVSGSFEPGTVIRYCADIPESSSSMYYVSSSYAYNQLSQNTASYYNWQQNKMR
jgi:hypothetical protein